ncbi:hypothetical protein ACHAWF_001921, partial [Thalassiosira exigua]
RLPRVRPPRPPQRRSRPRRSAAVAPSPPRRRAGQDTDEAAPTRSRIGGGLPEQPLRERRSAGRWGRSGFRRGRGGRDGERPVADGDREVGAERRLDRGGAPHGGDGVRPRGRGRTGGLGPPTSGRRSEERRGASREAGHEGRPADDAGRPEVGEADGGGADRRRTGARRRRSGILRHALLRGAQLLVEGEGGGGGEVDRRAGPQRLGGGELPDQDACAQLHGEERVSVRRHFKGARASRGVARRQHAGRHPVAESECGRRIAFRGPCLRGGSSECRVLRPQILLALGATIGPLAELLPFTFLIEAVNISLEQKVGGKILEVLSKSLDSRLVAALFTTDDKNLIGDVVKRTVLGGVLEFTGKSNYEPGDIQRAVEGGREGEGGEDRKLELDISSEFEEWDRMFVEKIETEDYVGNQARIMDMKIAMALEECEAISQSKYDSR